MSLLASHKSFSDEARNDLAQTTTGVGHAYREPVHFPPLSYKVNHKCCKHFPFSVLLVIAIALCIIVLPLRCLWFVCSSVRLQQRRLGPLPHSVTKPAQNPVLVDDVYTSTSKDHHRPQPMGTLLDHPMHRKAPGHWNMHYNWQMASKVGHHPLNTCITAQEATMQS